MPSRLNIARPYLLIYKLLPGNIFGDADPGTDFFLQLSAEDDQQAIKSFRYIVDRWGQERDYTDCRLICLNDPAFRIIDRTQGMPAGSPAQYTRIPYTHTKPPMVRIRVLKTPPIQ